MDILWSNLILGSYSFKKINGNCVVKIDGFLF